MAGSTGTAVAVTKPRPKFWLPNKWNDRADVVVVGFGGAGAMAAMEAKDAGANVLVLEKAPAGLDGGNTSVSGAGMIWFNDVAGGVEYLRSLYFGDQYVPEEVIRTYVENIVPFPDWLRSIGAQLIHIPHEVTFPMLPGANSLVNEVGFQGRGAGAFKFLKGEVTKRGIKIMYETPAKKLIQNPETREIVGVVAEEKGKTIYVKANRGTVLTCGGFEANREMLEQFTIYHGTPGFIVPLGTPYNTGDGIAMSMEVGAALWHMPFWELGRFGVKQMGLKYGSSPRFPRKHPKVPNVYVNKNGKRFMNEEVLLSHNKEHFAALFFEQASGSYSNLPCFVVGDDKWIKAGPIVDEGYVLTKGLYKWSRDNSQEIKSGLIAKGDTLGELAAKLGINPGGLVQNIEKYNAYCIAGEDKDYGRKDTLVAIETPPFYGAELNLPMVNTQGGPKHNAKSQVVDRDGKPIPRLYAAGELGSLYHMGYNTYGNFAEALIFGRIAGKNAAAEKPHR